MESNSMVALQSRHGSFNQFPVDAMMLFADQVENVKSILLRSGPFSQQIIDKVCIDYYKNLGLNEHYFLTSSPEAIAGHISCFMAAKILYQFAEEEFFPLIHQKREDEVVVITRASLHNRWATHNYAVEKMLEDEYLHLDGTGVPWRFQGYRSVGSLFEGPGRNQERLRTCFLQKPDYPGGSEQNLHYDVRTGQPPSSPPLTAARSLVDLVDKTFWKHHANTRTVEIFDRLNTAVMDDHTGLNLCVHCEPRDNGVYRVDFAFRRVAGQKRFYSNVGDIITAFGMFSVQKTVEPLKNGVSIITCFLQLTDEVVPEVQHLSIEARIERMFRAARMRHIFPNSLYNDLCLTRVLGTLEATYCHAASQFIQQFSHYVGPTFAKIARVLNDSKDVSSQELYDVRRRLKQSPFTENTIFRLVKSYPAIVSRLYAEFRENHHPDFGGGANVPYKEDPTLEKDIECLDSVDGPAVFGWFKKFNRAILKTNFFKDGSIALAFCCKPDFLPESDYPTQPYGLIFFTGNSFYGFHCRFAEIARGGIRVVPSCSTQMYHRNSQDAFDEVYNLCATQSLKNKDIPEGGSKGVILLAKTDPKKPEETTRLMRYSFMRYIDAFLDILLPSSQIVDRIGREEVCFLGPDENTGTGQLMDWAAQHARHRGAWFWKAFTTGKEPIMGGIPHDLYGMTTSSVETFVRGALKKLNLEESETTKCQTGGPDGDLGSNSIRMSKAKLTSLVDGAGVVADPEGLDREELLRLVQRRFDSLPTSSMEFDASKLSKKGFKVSITCRDVTLPDGTNVSSGLQFRNEFHLHPLSSATLFNPNGGRPASITPDNLHRLFDKDGRPRFRLIVEGANLFITEDARIALEQKGVILFKDASTNKGGVTSSSFEVLAALAFDDESFERLMGVKDTAAPPPFYKAYVEAVQAVIRRNAEEEFELLWREKERTNIPMSKLTDMVSGKILAMKNEILQRDLLWNDNELRRSILHRAIPKVLVPEAMSLDTLTSRVPNAYLRAIFASYLASKFYYRYGLDGSPFSFLEFVSMLKTNKETSSLSGSAEGATQSV